MTEEILNALARIKGLRVAARTSTFAYRDANPTIEQIREDLGVDAILEGSVRRDGDQLRITAQLIETETGFHLWSDTYDRSVDNVFAIQSEIAQQIALALEAELSPEEAERIRSVPTDDPAAYAAFQRGRLHMDRQENRQDALTGVSFFEEAVGLDPAFAPAHARLARARMWLYWKWPGYGDQLPLAVEALDRAVELAPGETAQVAFDATQEEPIEGPAAFDIAYRITDGQPMYEGQALVQSSSSMPLPSSHSSPSSTMPSPQTVQSSRQSLPLPPAGEPGGSQVSPF